MIYNTFLFVDILIRKARNRSDNGLFPTNNILNVCHKLGVLQGNPSSESEEYTLVLVYTLDLCNSLSYFTKSAFHVSTLETDMVNPNGKSYSNF